MAERVEGVDCNRNAWCALGAEHVGLCMGEAAVRDMRDAELVALESTQPTPIVRPHSRACGIRPHEHGADCHSNCPTCGGRDNGVKDQGFKPEASRRDGVVPITRVRVRAQLKHVNDAWDDVALSLQMTPDGQVWPLGEFKVARRRSGDREAPELMVIGLLVNALQEHGAEASLHGGERMQSEIGSARTEVIEFRYWATLSARLSVAIQPATVGYPFVQVIGLA